MKIRQFLLPSFLLPHCVKLQTLQNINCKKNRNKFQCNLHLISNCVLFGNQIFGSLAYYLYFLGAKFIYELVSLKMQWHTVCPRRSDPFYIASYYINWATTSWTYSTKYLFLSSAHNLP